MTDATLAAFLRERMALYDAAADTSSGSDFDTKVLQPLLLRLGGSPLDTSLVQLAQDVVEAEFPDVFVRPGSALHDLVIRFFEVAAAPLLRELRFGRVANSLNNAAAMRRDELGGYLANFFLGLDDGRKEQVVFRVFYRTPLSALATPLTEIRIGEDVFYPVSSQSITAAAMALNLTGGEYFFDVTAEAAQEGSRGLEVGQLGQTQEFLGHSRVQVKTVVQAGVDQETPAAAVVRAEESITQRNLVTSSGVRITLPDGENFPELGNIVVVRTGDAEMDRDIVWGPVAISGIPGGILGYGPPDIGGGQRIHIGGKTDIYCQAPQVQFAVDIDNIANIGRFLVESSTGYTLSDADGGVDLLHDDRMTFNRALEDQPGFPSGPLDTTGSGFYLRIGGNEFAVAGVDADYLQIYTDANSTTKPVGYAPATPDGAKDPTGVGIRTGLSFTVKGNVELVANLSPLPYAVYFRDFRGDPSVFAHARGYVADVPLWSLVAEDAAGDPVLNASTGAPIAQRPGMPGLAALLDSSAAPVDKSDVYFIEDPTDVGNLQLGPNIAVDNLQLPMTRISRVEVVDFSTGEVLETLPYGAPVRAVAQDAIPVGGIGLVRLFFDSPASASVFRDRHAATALYDGDTPLLAAPIIPYSGATPAGVLSGSWGAYLDYVDGNGDVQNVFRVVVDGASTDLPIVTGASAPANPATITNLLRSIRVGDRLVYWRSNTFDDAVVCTIKTINATSLEVYWPAGTFPPAAAGGWTNNEADFAVCQGVRPEDALLDSVTGHYYADFIFENAGSATVAENAELTWLLEANILESDPSMPSAVPSPVRVEGWRALPHLSQLSFSLYERCALRLPWQVNDDVFLFDPVGYGTNVGAPRIRVTYEAAPALKDVADFVQHPDRRPLGEELLVRHLLPALVGGQVTYRGSSSQAVVEAAVRAHVNGVAPEVGLQVSSVAKIVDDLGATYIRHPITLTLSKCDRNRARILELVVDAQALDRLAQAYADATLLTITKL